MNDQESWHSQDAFWDIIEPVLFNEQRQSSSLEEVDKMVNLLQIEDQAKILDLCCGIGRHSLELSKRGYDVVGVDRTMKYLEQARLEAEKLNLNATFLLGDMREYCVPDHFDIIINVFGSFGYFENSEDDYKVVKNMFISLRPGGKFMIETNGKEILARDFRKWDWTEEGDLLILSERKVCQNWGRIETRWIVIKGTNRVEYQVSVRSYSAVELSTLLINCGFTNVQVYGSLDGIEYDQMAQRLVVVGQKQ